MASSGPAATNATADFTARDTIARTFKGMSLSCPPFQLVLINLLIIQVGLQSALVGTFVSAIQNSLHKHNEGAKGVFTRTGGTIGLFTAMGAGFTLVDSTVANFRETDDAWNGVALVLTHLFVRTCSDLSTLGEVVQLDLWLV